MKKKKTRNKISNIIILCVLIVFVCEGCAYSSGQTSNKIQENEVRQASEHLLLVWSDYLSVLEKVYSVESWALSYVDTYLQSGDWNDLSEARTALITSSIYLTEIGMSEDDLSAEEYVCLAGAGIDTGYQSQEFAMVSDTIDEVHMIVREYFLESMECNVFLEKSVSILKEESALHKKYIDCMCSYSCTMTNYLLFTLGDEKDGIAFWSDMKEKYPVLTSGSDNWIWDENRLKEEADRCLDDCKDLMKMQADILSSMEASLYDMERLVENQDTESLIASAFVMKNMPPLLPMPEWYNSSDTKYLSFIEEDNGDVTYPQYGDDFTDKKRGVQIKIENITPADIENYIKDINPIAEKTWQTANDTWYISMDSYYIQIHADHDAATFLFAGQDVTFVPPWYLNIP